MIPFLVALALVTAAFVGLAATYESADAPPPRTVQAP